jgi:hypothetical protein
VIVEGDGRQTADRAEEEEPRGGEEQAGEDAVVGGVEAEGGVVGGLTCGDGDIDAFATDEGAEALTGGGEEAEEETDGFHLYARRAGFTRKERDGDAGEDDEAPEDLGCREACAEPEPLTDGGDGSGEALRHEDREP